MGGQAVEKKVADSPRNSRLPLGTIFLFSIFVLAGVIVFSLWNPRPAMPPHPRELAGVLPPEPRQLAPFALVDQTGAPFTEQRFAGKWTFLFFGYTYCPDVCPATLSILTAVRDQLVRQGGEVLNTQFLFVSVDPERDTPEKLAEYMAFFDREFVAATGSRADIDDFSRQVGAGYMIQEESSPGQYLVNHSSAIFLVDPKGRVAAAFSQPHNAGTIVTLFRKIQAYYSSI